MQITGSCFCGDIAYAAEMDDLKIGICHCRDCQKFSGSAFRTSGFVPSSRFQFTRGSPSYFDKTADSGAIRRMAFCGTCGTHLCSLPSQDAEQDGYVSLRVATSDQFDQMEIAAELFCASRVAWLADLPGCMQFSGMPQ